jgi:hypothetical protein
MSTRADAVSTHAVSPVSTTGGASAAWAAMLVDTAAVVASAATA